MLEEHIEFLVEGANRILGLIRRNFWFCDKKVKLTLYETLVCNVSLVHITNVIIRRVEGQQRASGRFCKSVYHYTSSVSIMLERLGLEPLETRRKLGRLYMMYKIIHGLVYLNIH